MSGQRDAVECLARQVSAALAAADLTSFRDLLDPEVRWGAPGDPAPPCQNRDEVLSWYRRGMTAGTRARVSETLVSGDRILVGLKVTGPVPAEQAGEEAERWQVLTVRDGRVAAIVGFDDRDEAAAWAGLAPGAARPESTSWSPPGHRLAGDGVELRLPEPADALALHEYAAQPDGMADGWVPLAAAASLASCEALISDWLKGWHVGRSFHGPALVIVPAGQSRLVGQVGLTDRGDRLVELSYGVAPEHRGRGYATCATRLAALWLLRDRQADKVELRIASENLASQRVAAAAGFGPAGTVISRVPATGESYEDLRYVLVRSSGT